MRILAHIHTFNDADIIERTIASLRAQTHPVDDILVVDNASRDDTLAQPAVNGVSVLRLAENGGTSGAVHSGFRYALAHDYDWIWVFDADSTPQPDALAKLLDLYAGLPQDQRDRTAFVACMHYNMQDGIPRHGSIFTEQGVEVVNPAPEAPYYLCHTTIWSGVLYRLAAVREIGLPNVDYVLDNGESEYGYQIKKAGYLGFVCQDAVLEHNIRGFLGIPQEPDKPAPPIRCYYVFRNALYFALYDFRERRSRLLIGTVLGLAGMVVNFLRRPRNHAPQLRACARGIWHGVTGNIAARY
jgi:GT2 family glycosyltransferase